MKFIAPEKSKKGAAHYNPAVISNGMLYISGQLPIDPDTGKIVEGGIESQTKKTLQNLDRILHAAGITKEHVVQCRIYVDDIANWDSVNEVYALYFGDHRPARAIVPCGKLHYGALVEIEAIAEMELS